MCWLLFDQGWKERGNILIWIDWFALNWDRGLVNCGTNILRGCWLSWQNEIQVSLHWHLSLQNVSPLISLLLWSSPIFSYLLPLSPIFKSFFLPHQWGKSLIKHPSYLFSFQHWLLTSSVFSETCYFCLHILLIVVWPGLVRKGKHLDLNWLICIKLGSWSCQLWYQHPSWVLTLLTKRDSGFIALISFISKCVDCCLT